MSKIERGQRVRVYGWHATEWIVVRHNQGLTVLAPASGIGHRRQALTSTLIPVEGA